MIQYKDNIFIMDHPLIQHKLSILRNKETGTKIFRELISEIASLICYEASKDLPLVDVEVETPIAKVTCKRIAGKKLVFVPILRAGLGMVDGVMTLFPSAKIGHIGLYRDPETLKPVEYFCKLPEDIEHRDVVLIDPMLATGGSATDAITLIKKYKPKSIKFMCILCAPEGLDAVNKEHPDVKFYCGCLDSHLNTLKYIVPGLGDAGDRIFGTK